MKFEVISPPAISHWLSPEEEDDALFCVFVERANHVYVAVLTPLFIIILDELSEQSFMVQI